MKKIILLFAAITLVSCSDDDNSSSSTGGSTFDLDGAEFELQQGVNMTEIKMADVFEVNGESYDRSTVTITGLAGMSSTATVAFDLYYKSGTSIEGTYNIDDTDFENTDSFQDFLAANGRGCMGWTSAGVIFSLNGGGMTRGNNPGGTVKLIVNSATKYTVKYDGNFKIYDDELEFVRNMPADINITDDVTIQQ